MNRVIFPGNSAGASLKHLGRRPECLHQLPSSPVTAPGPHWSSVTTAVAFVAVTIFPGNSAGASLKRQ